MPHSAKSLIALGSVVVSTNLWADQPVFNEMPRWDEGWGIQLVQEYRNETDYLQKDRVIASGLSEDLHITHLEGVYTWDKSVRMTFKLPYVMSAKRELPNGSGGKITQRDEGLGDLTLALPLKKYINGHGESSSFTLAPQIRVPLGQSKDEYEIYDHEWGGGLALGYEKETYRTIFSIGTSAWHFGGDEPFQVGASLDLGVNIHAEESAGHIKWENDLKWEDDGSLTWSSGPSFYWRFTDTVHTKVSWKNDLIDRQGEADHGNGNSFTIGIAWVY